MVLNLKHACPVTNGRLLFLNGSNCQEQQTGLFKINPALVVLQQKKADHNLESGLTHFPRIKEGITEIFAPVWNFMDLRGKSGGAWAARTPDHLIKSQMLYQLS